MIGGGSSEKTYQLHSPDVPVVPQTLSEVQLVHKIKDESERVFASGIDPNEWYKNIATVIETTARRCFFVQPLRVTLNGQNVLRLHLRPTK